MIVLALSGVAKGRPARMEIDAIVRPAIEMNYCDGIAIGIIDADGREVLGYGKTAPNGSVPDGKTIFEIGSLSKLFTGMLLAQMVQSGQVRLDEPVADLLPAGTQMPAAGGAKITLLDLTDQHSGLPRMPPNFDPASDSNPYADFTPGKLYKALAQTRLSAPPGRKYEYSNLGVGLLGFALARRAGCSYEDLLIARICKPLGMNDTRINLSPRLKARLAQGRPDQNWDFDALAGAGAIRSCADDLLTFAGASAGLVDSPLFKAMDLTHQRRASADNGSDIAMGWFIAKRTGAFWHNGQTGGYHSFIAFVPKQFALVVLGNTAGSTVDTIGNDLINAMLGLPVRPLKLRKAIPTDPAKLKELVGRYALSPVFVISITREGDRLFEQATGQSRSELFLEKPDQFFLRGVDAQIRFERDRDGKVWRLVLHQNDTDTPGGKIR
jgi:CubicO group peptidase (beta-lactamase class C family)